MNQLTNGYDLEERTARFGESVIEFYGELIRDTVSRPLISQLVRSATSVGANYAEANAASSKKDFRNKIYICKKECHETKHWLRMLARHFPEKRSEIIILWKECQELAMIFQKITNTLRSV